MRCVRVCACVCVCVAASMGRLYIENMYLHIWWRDSTYDDVTLHMMMWHYIYTCTYRICAFYVYYIYMCSHKTHLRCSPPITYRSKETCMCQKRPSTCIHMRRRMHACHMRMRIPLTTDRLYLYIYTPCIHKYSLYTYMLSVYINSMCILYVYIYM